MLNIDYYMRDLKKHALEEYDEVHTIELRMLNENGEQPTAEQMMSPEYQLKLNERYGLIAG